MSQTELASSCSFSCAYQNPVKSIYRVCTNQLVFIVMSDINITTPGNESHQLQAPGLAFDCAGIIEQVIEHTSAKYANTMATIANTMENQQQ